MKATIVQEILLGEHDADLDAIDRAVRRRKQLVFRRGSRVLVTDGRMIGRTGRVVKVNLKRVTVAIDGDSYQEWLIPVSMLEVAS